MNSYLKIYVRQGEPSKDPIPRTDFFEAIHRACVTPLFSWFAFPIAVGHELAPMPRKIDTVNAIGILIIGALIVQGVPKLGLALLTTAVIMTAIGAISHAFSISRHVLSQKPVAVQSMMDQLSQAIKNKTQEMAQTNSDLQVIEAPEPNPDAFLLFINKYGVNKLIPFLSLTDCSYKILAEALEQDPRYWPKVASHLSPAKINPYYLITACKDTVQLMQMFEACKETNPQALPDFFYGLFNQQGRPEFEMCPLEFLTKFKEDELPKFFPVKSRKQFFWYHPKLIFALWEIDPKMRSQIITQLPFYKNMTVFFALRNEYDFLMLASFLTFDVVKQTAEMVPNSAKDTFLAIGSGPKILCRGKERIQLYEQIKNCRSIEDLRALLESIKGADPTNIPLIEEKIAVFFHFAFLKQDLQEAARDLLVAYGSQGGVKELDKIFRPEILDVAHSGIRPIVDIFQHEQLTQDFQPIRQ